MATNSTTPNPELAQGHWIIDGTGWSFMSVLYDTTNIKHKNITLNPANIVMFEYTNQWNALVLTGQMVYKDIERDLGKLFRIPHLILRVEWAENLAEKKFKTDSEGRPAGDYWVEKPIKKEDYFSHIFLVNKMEIVSHDTHSDVTTYRLELVSASWYKLSQVCQYSNYNLKKPEPITDIICRLLIDAVGEDKVASQTFVEDPCRTDISIYYTTTQKDNYFTAITYLLNRMYMEPSSFDVENHPRIILWDEKENKYRMAKLNDDTTCLTTKHNFIQLSRFYQISEGEVNPFQPGWGKPHAITPSVASFSKMSYTRFVKDFYTRHYWDVSITKDKFVRRVILNEKIQNLFKSPNASQERDSTFYPNPNITAEESVPDLQKLLSSDKTNYLVDETKWSNQRHLYNDCIQAITSRDTFILTRGNKVCHQPYQYFCVIRDKNLMSSKEILDTDRLSVDSVDHSPGQSEEKKTAENPNTDNQFFGGWVSFKTTHVIMISDSPMKDSVPYMFERIQLTKPFEIAPVPQKIRK